MDAKRMNRMYYVEGSAARQLAPVQEPIRREERQQETQQEKRKVKAPGLSHGINFLSMTLFAVAMAITLYLCYDYLKVQGNIVQLERDIVNLEADVNAKVLENDALEASLGTTLDLEEVFMTAVGELGMVYPNKNEVISYTANEDGHVIQYRDIPE